MDVEDTVRERVDELRSDETHEPGEAHEPDIARPQLRRKRMVVIISRREGTMREHERFDSCRTRALETHSIIAVRYDDHDRSSESPLCNCVDQRLQIAAAAGDQHAEPAIGSHL